MGYFILFIMGVIYGCIISDRSSCSNCPIDTRECCKHQEVAKEEEESNT